MSANRKLPNKRCITSSTRGRGAGLLLELPEVDRLKAIERAGHRRQRIFKACRAIKQHLAVIFRDPTVVEALLVGGVGGGPLWVQQKPLLARHFVQRR